MRRVKVTGNHGTLHVDALTGMVVRYEPAGDGTYCDIIRIDLDKWRETHPDKDVCDCDIPAVGFWFEGVASPLVYCGPEVAWRAELALGRVVVVDGGRWR